MADAPEASKAPSTTPPLARRYRPARSPAPSSSAPRNGQEDGEVVPGAAGRLSYPLNEVSPGQFRFDTSAMQLRGTLPDDFTPRPVSPKAFSFNPPQRLHSVNTLTVRWVVTSLASYAESVSQPGSSPAGADLTMRIRLPELGRADLVEFTARQHARDQVRVTMALERDAVGRVPQIDLIACWKDVNKGTGAVEMRRERVHTFAAAEIARPPSKGRSGQSWSCSFGDKEMRTITDLDVVIHRPAPTCIDTLAALTTAPVIRNDVVFIFPGATDGPPRQLWARKSDLISRSTHFASLFASGMSESELTPADEPLPSFTSSRSSGEDDEDDADIASAASEGASATIECAAHRIIVADSSYDVYRAVLLYLASQFIEFAPLKSQGALLRSSYVADYVRQHPSLPRPVSAIAVFKLCERLDLGELSSLALRSILNSIDATNAVAEAFGSLRDHPAAREQLVGRVVEHWDAIRANKTLDAALADGELGAHGTVALALFKQLRV